ncbi:hypothetical protein [Microcoleus sp.]|uniref:hypothetical protein n=1 Tax=Microcoleus sp. TaxID=44472 RepID=UPI003524F3F8
MERTYQISGLNATFSYPIWETAEIEETFLELAEQWRRETGMMSLVTKMSMHPAYQRIIGMGQAVVPLILRELEQEPDHWFWALQAITGANPVKSEQRGRLKQMAQAWIEWGRENGYKFEPVV